MLTTTLANHWSGGMLNKRQLDEDNDGGFTQSKKPKTKKGR
jgi:hypothetical protein